MIKHFNRLWSKLSHPIKFYMVICVDILRPIAVIFFMESWVTAVMYVVWWLLMWGYRESD